MMSDAPNDIGRNLNGNVGPRLIYLRLEKWAEKYPATCLMFRIDYYRNPCSEFVHSPLL